LERSFPRMVACRAVRSCGQWSIDITSLNFPRQNRAMLPRENTWGPRRGMMTDYTCTKES
jgi:hypothetical protein